MQRLFHDLTEHVACQSARLRVVTRTVVGIDQLATIGQEVHGTMTEFVGDEP